MGSLRDRRPGWSAVSLRLGPYLDPAVGLAAVALSLGSLFAADVASIDPRLHNPDATAVIATVLATGALAWRRTYPFTSFAAMVIGGLVVSVSDHYVGLLSIFILFSLYSLAAHGRRRDGLIGLVVGVASFVGLALSNVPDLGTSVLLQSLALVVAAWALGDAIRSRRRHQRDHHREQVEAAVAEERLRIARELHDVTAHSMSLIAVQAGVGSHLIHSDVDAAQRCLEVIADTSHRALEQTRSMLGMLRQTRDDGIRPPTQGLDDIDTLLYDVRVAGLAVRLNRPPAMPHLDPAASLAAYRIVQESLTNVIKHSAASTAILTLTTTAADLTIEIIDPGPPRLHPKTGSGQGLLGLQERTRMVGGSLDTASYENGFRVYVTLPIRAQR